MILEALGGTGRCPRPGTARLPVTYRRRPRRRGPRRDARPTIDIRPIWTVTGLIRGSERPDEVVIVGNHRDAWVYGGVDPSSGSAALLELARTLGEL